MSYWYTIGTTPANTWRMTLSSTAWVEVHSSLPTNVDRIQVYHLGSGSLIDIGIGASGAEVAQISAISGYNSQWETRITPFDVSWPAGTRVAARKNTAAGANDCGLAITCRQGASLMSPRFVSQSSDLKSIASYSGTANTKGSYTELFSSTTFMARKITLMFAKAAAQTTTYQFLCDLAVGGAGSEAVIVPDFFAEFLAQDTGGPQFYEFDVDIPPGSRVSARCQCVNSTQRTLDVTAVLTS